MTFYGIYESTKTTRKYLTNKIRKFSSMRINREQFGWVCLLIGIMMFSLRYSKYSIPTTTGSILLFYLIAGLTYKCLSQVNPQKLRKRCLKLSSAIIKFVEGLNDFSRFGLDRVEIYAIKKMEDFSDEYDKELNSVHRDINKNGIISKDVTINQELNKLHKSHKVRGDMMRLGEILKDIALKIPEFG